MGLSFKETVVRNNPSAPQHTNPIFGESGTGMGESSCLSGSFRPSKVNRCLAKSDNRPVVEIQPEAIADDINYLSKHALICKFLGIRVSLSFLESWARRTWSPEGEMDVLLAANGYFQVVFSCMSDRNKVFEGGPYFYNQVGLFIKPWHVGFNPTEELPSQVLVWVRLPWLPLEFWREDIFSLVASQLGKPVGPSRQTMEKKVITYARVCVEIDLNKPLPDSIEIRLGSSSWIQQLDYETLPFRCRFCHEYGHLQRVCPKSKLTENSKIGLAGAPHTQAKGKAPMREDTEGFIPVRGRNRGRGQKRTFKDRQTDEVFNRFDGLDDLEQFDGTIANMSVSHELLEAKEIGGEENNVALVDPQEGELGALMDTTTPVRPVEELETSGDKDLQEISAHARTKACTGNVRQEESKNKGSPSFLGIHQKTIRKDTPEKTLKVGRKKDQEKVKLVGETLVESGSVKTIDSHFPLHQK
ncbi:uncharacterized protein LOC131042571 [Cryptomeria japonica]|uniref:uncharacterized protein LOC131042571 n=1 Tax=Cryptomeria japonica TaxID=3369 RepID=UPI0025ACAED5|nr:uncharacterized protein LOC131042571 [Cryptomeria japonica]